MKRYIDPVALDLAAQRLGAANDEQLGKAIGITPQAIRNLRNRDSEPTLRSLIKIANAAGIPWEHATIVATPHKNIAA